MNEIEITAEDELKLLRYDELAIMLGVSTKKARESVAAGDFPLVELGPKTHRVTLASVKRFINAGGRRSDAK